MKIIQFEPHGDGRAPITKRLGHDVKALRVPRANGRSRWSVLFGGMAPDFDCAVFADSGHRTAEGHEVWVEQDSA